MSVLAFATNAVQLTPFTPIDRSLLAFESMAHVNMHALLSWMHTHFYIHQLLEFIYDSLAYQMCFLPLALILLGRFEHLNEYYFLLFFTALIGFSIYYFFPTTAPASVISSPFFSPYQIATGLKFQQIHHHIRPTTREGGLIAFPSFHTIWALLNVYLLKEWIIPCLFLLGLNMLLLISCVLLGWHYLIDVLGGIILVLMAYSMMLIANKNSPVKKRIIHHA